jgi:hypothetical protein
MDPIYSTLIELGLYVFVWKPKWIPSTRVDPKSTTGVVMCDSARGDFWA